MYKLVLLDYAMPEMDGPQVSKTIQRLANERGEKPPMICCFTAYAENSFKNTAFDSGMDAFMTKPLDVNELKQLLKVLD